MPSSNKWLNSLILAILEQSWCSVSSRSGLGWRRESWKGGQVLGNIQVPLGLIWDQAINTERGSVTKNWTHTVFLAGCGWKWQGPSWYIVHLQFQENHPWAKLVGFHHWTNHIQLSLLCFQSFTLDFKLTWGQMYHTDTRLLRRLLVPSSRCALFCFIPMCFIDPSYLQLLYIQAGCLLSWMFSDGTGQQAGPRTSSRTCS